MDTSPEHSTALPHLRHRHWCQALDLKTCWRQARPWIDQRKQSFFARSMVALPHTLQHKHMLQQRAKRYAFGARTCYVTMLTVDTHGKADQGCAAAIAW